MAQGENGHDAKGVSLTSSAIDSMNVDTAGIDAQLAVVLSYNGAPFAGFARQPGQLTVQGDFERAASLALRRPVEVVCAGRTDAGVHARGQVVSFPITHDEAEERKLFRLKRSLQALTDDAVAIQTLSVMPPDFSARFSAIEREYRYLIVPGDRKPLFLKDWCWDVRRALDVDAMNEAAALLVGEHDFKSFCLAASAKDRNTVRTLSQVEVVPVNVLGEEALSVRVAGTAFLHSMVRSIVGTLVMVGSGLRDAAWVGEVLEARNRQAAGENAPACGLVFWRVRYAGGVPCYESDSYAGLSATPAPTGNSTGVSAADVKLAEAAIAALERAEEDAGSDFAPVSSNTGSAFSDAVLTAPLPEEVEKAAAAPGPKGQVRVNDTGGKPAIEAAPRTKRIAPADPKPAEGEASLSFEVHRDSAATRAIRAEKERKSKRKGKNGLFNHLFGRKDDPDA